MDNDDHTRRRLRARRAFSPVKLLIEGRAFLALILIIVVFSSLSPNYLTVDNLLIMASHVAIYAILGMGMLLVILNGGIDLSVGSTLGFTGIIAGFLLRRRRDQFLRDSPSCRACPSWCCCPAPSARASAS